ncbi:MAG TPA: peptidase M19 [Rhodobiaceae bacterium]|nr:peptidase M19 [Rhodobiaceae bacterium]
MKRVAIGFGVLLLAVYIGIYFFAPSLIEASVNLVEEHEPYNIADEARELHSTLTIIDLHSDTMLWGRNPLDRSATGHVDVPRMVEGNMALQVFSSTTKSPSGQNYESNSADAPDQLTIVTVLGLWPISSWTSIYERAVYQARELYAAEEQDPEALMIVTSRSDLDALLDARTKGKPIVGGILLTEGSHPLEGELANVQKLYDEGYRIMGLQHFFDNRLGGSLHGQSGEGLTEFGKAAVREMERLGIIIDVAHSSPAVVRDVLALSNRPIIVSHTGLKGACHTKRNLEDDLMKEIAAKGGLIGIGFWDAAVCDYTPAGIVRSVRYGIDLLGVDHVALGSDYDGSTTVLMDASEIPALTHEMLKAGFTEEEIRKVMGENAVRLLRDLLPQS